MKKRRSVAQLQRIRERRARYAGIIGMTVVAAGLAIAGGVLLGSALERGQVRIEVPAPAPCRLAPRAYTLPMEYAQLVIRYCDETGAPVWLVCRPFDWESGWNPRCVGPENDNGTRDYGLAALNSAYIEHFRIYNDGARVDPLDPECAIRVGIRYLAALHEKTGSWREAVRRYAGNRPSRHTAKIMGDEGARTALRTRRTPVRNEPSSRSVRSRAGGRRCG